VGNFDPYPYWREVEIPTLVLYGSEDTNVPAEASRERLEALEKDNIAVLIYEGSGHALEDPPGMGNSFFREDALHEIEAFIKGPGLLEG
jgi:pimeloyl-ACP methyl ester carboxylesterase